MQLEDVYKQLSIVDFIRVFYRMGNAHLSRAYESCGLGYGQHQFLSVLYREDGLSQEELTQRLAVDKATTARAVGKLKEAGYVQVTVDENDKRVHHVFLTEQARGFENQFFAIAQEWETYLLNNLQAQDKENLLQLFRKIVGQA